MHNIRRLLNIRPGEGRLIAWVLGYAICAAITDVLANTTAYALFLDEFDTQRLPYIYLGVSGSTVLISMLYLQLSKHYSLAQTLLGNHIFILFTIIGYRLSLGLLNGRWLIFSLPIWHGVLNVLLYIALWNLLGRLFNLQQGKRLFGLFGAGQQLTLLVTGLFVPALVLWVGAPNLLWVAAGGGAGALLFLTMITRHTTELNRQTNAEGHSRDPKQQTSGAMLADAYVRGIFLLFTLFTLGSYFIDNIFYDRVESQFNNAAQLAGFLGIFNGVNGGLGLVMQIFVVNRLLSRYGVRAALVLTPLLLLVGTSLFVLTGFVWGMTPALFWLVVGMYLIQQVMNDTDNTASNLLYQPLPAGLRTHIQTLSDGILSPGAAGLAGLILLILTNLLHLNALQLAAFLLLILIGWLAAGVGLGRMYVQRVQQALHQRLIQGNTAFQPDRVSVEVIQQNLYNPHPGAVLYALDLLTATQDEKVNHVLTSLLKHESSIVRLEVLARLERRGAVTTLSAIEQCFHTDADTAVRSAALQSLAALGGLGQRDELYAYLSASEPHLRRSVMIGLLRSGELEAILAVGETLTHLVNSATVADRLLGAQVLGESSIAGFYRPLLKLLQDVEPQVQRSALAAAAKLQHPKLWPRVIECLMAPGTRSAAQNALIAGGETVLSVLKQAAAGGNDQTRAPLRERQLRIALARICGRTGGAQAVELLLANLDYLDLQVRTQSLLALRQCGYYASVDARPRIEQQLQNELALAAWSIASIVDLGEEETTQLVRSALEASLVQQRIRLFLWLSLLYDAATMQRVRDAFGAGQGVRRQASEEQRAYALETLDVVVAKRVSKHLLSLLDDLTPEQQRTRLAADFPQPTLESKARLLAIITQGDAGLPAWVRAVALYTVVTAPTAEVDIEALDMAATAMSVSASELLCETAAWALKRLRQEQAGDKPNLQQDQGKTAVLLTIEKVLILKTVDIFAQAPDEILVDIATLLKEVEVLAGTTIFVQGEPGDSMYIIVEGEVEASDGERVFTHMGERQVFGEMALLDNEPRTATIRATRATRLLRLDQEPFYELMDDRIEIARGVIHVLLQRLRARTNDVNRLQAQLNGLAT